MKFARSVCCLVVGAGLCSVASARPGACCLPGGACFVTTQTICESHGGTYAGDDVTCADANCPRPATGACCLQGGFCFVLVPNVQSLAIRFLGTRYRYIMAEHLNYFTADTLQRLVAHEHLWSVVALRTTHFNPIVIWQDWRRARERVPDSERAQLLRKTTAWKQSIVLSPARLLYGAVEGCLRRIGLADNLVIVLRRR